MAKVFIEIQAQDSDTLSWKDKDNNDVDVNICRIENDKWVRGIKSQNGRMFRIIDERDYVAPKKSKK